MVAPSEETFRQHFTALSRTERAAFVADLLRAQGRDVAVRGLRIEVEPTDVESDGDPKTLIVGRPEPGTSPDVVVCPEVHDAGTVERIRDRLSVSSTADADVLPASELRTRLLYAIDRETAETLVRDHFGAELRTTTDPASTSPSDDSPSPVGETSRTAAAVVLLVVAVGLLGAAVVLGGPGAPLGIGGPDGTPDQEGPTPTVDDPGPGGDPEESTPSTIPVGGDGPSAAEGDESLAVEGSGTSTTGGDGTSTGGGAPTWSPAEGGVEADDVEALLADHRRALETTDKRTLQLSYEGTPRLPAVGVFLSAPTVDGPIEYELTLGTTGEYYITERLPTANGSADGEATVESDGDEQGTVERYGVENTEYRLTGPEANRTVRRVRLPAGYRPGGQQGDLWTGLLETYLATGEVDAQRRGTRLDYREEIEFTTTEDPASQHELIATGPPEYIESDVRDYRAVAIVRADGLVERLEVRFVDTETGSPVVIEATVEEANVPRPEWITEYRTNDADPWITRPAESVAGERGGSITGEQRRRPSTGDNRLDE